MRRFPTLSAVLALAGLAALAAAAHAGPAIPPPDVVLSAGGTFAANSKPSGGGASASLALLWPLDERWRMGVVGYADDIGTSYIELVDPNDGTPLGPAASLHRWTWGGAWRVEGDVWQRDRWVAGGTGAWGWWRVEDDRRGRVLVAASAVGFRLGAQVRHAFDRGRSLGLEVGYHQLARDRHTSWDRVTRYATAALQYRWAGSDLHD